VELIGSPVTAYTRGAWAMLRNYFRDFCVLLFLRNIELDCRLCQCDVISGADVAEGRQ
jgi:hypothetical protein